MGSGKSTVGPLVAAELGWAFLDTDRLIEQRARKTIPEIFQELGELRFRALEASVIAEVLTTFPPEGEGGAIIALGGGALLREETRARLLGADSVVYLDATLDTLVSRLASAQNTAQRPLLSRGGGVVRLEDLRERVNELLLARLPVYDKIAWRVSTNGRSPAEIAVEIVSEITRRLGKGS